MDDCFVRVENVKKYFYIKSNQLFKKKKTLRAVDNVSFTIKRNESVGLVGESGCGKSTLARLILRLIDTNEGKIYFDGEDITKIKGGNLRTLRKKMQIIFQDPYSSLNPRKTILDIISAPIKTHQKNQSKKEIEDRVKQLLNLVGLSERYLHHYPHEFSGGQRQRIGIARSIALNPGLIVCDEPVSALDVSIQAQVINLLMDIKQQFGLSYLFIAHDLSVVKHISDKIIVMYLGKIVEIASKNDLFDNPMHPYTKALISAIPDIDINSKKERIILEGDVELPIDKHNGCVFASRCFKKQNICFEKEPEFKNLGNNRMCLCHFV